MQNQNQNAMNVQQPGMGMHHLQPGFDAPPMGANPIVYVTPSPSASPMFVPMNAGRPPFAYSEPLRQVYPNAINNNQEIPKPKEVWRRQSSTCRKVFIYSNHLNLVYFVRLCLKTSKISTSLILPTIKSAIATYSSESQS